MVMAGRSEVRGKGVGCSAWAWGVGGGEDLSDRQSITLQVRIDPQELVRNKAEFTVSHRELLLCLMMSSPMQLKTV